MGLGKGYASVILPTGRRVLLVICGRSRASSGAETRGVRSGVIFHAHVARRSVDCTTEFHGAGEAVNWVRRRQLHISIASRRHDMVCMPPLAPIFRSGGANRQSPERAFVVYGRWRIRAGVGWCHRRVPLDDHVEGDAPVGYVTIFLALDRVVAFEGVEAHKAVLVGGAVQVLEPVDKGVALRRGGIAGDGLGLG